MTTQNDLTKLAALVAKMATKFKVKDSSGNVQTLKADANNEIDFSNISGGGSSDKYETGTVLWDISKDSKKLSEMSFDLTKIKNGLSFELDPNVPLKNGSTVTSNIVETTTLLAHSMNGSFYNSASATDVYGRAYASLGDIYSKTVLIKEIFNTGTTISDKSGGTYTVNADTSFPYIYMTPIYTIEKDILKIPNTYQSSISLKKSTTTYLTSDLVINKVIAI